MNQYTFSNCYPPRIGHYGNETWSCSFSASSQSLLLASVQSLQLTLSRSPSISNYPLPKSQFLQVISSWVSGWLGFCLCPRLEYGERGIVSFLGLSLWSFRVLGEGRPEVIAACCGLEYFRVLERLLLKLLLMLLLEIFIAYMYASFLSFFFSSFFLALFENSYLTNSRRNAASVWPSRTSLFLEEHSLLQF